VTVARHVRLAVTGSRDRMRVRRVNPVRDESIERVLEDERATECQVSRHAQIIGARKPGYFRQIVSRRRFVLAGRRVEFVMLPIAVGVLRPRVARELLVVLPRGLRPDSLAIFVTLARPVFLRLLPFFVKPLVHGGVRLRPGGHAVKLAHDTVLVLEFDVSDA